MALTPRFGLTAFGGDQEGSLTDDGQKYTLSDRYLIDKIMAALERHNHKVVDAVIEPADAPTAVLGTDGALPAGREYDYVVTFVDENGLETISSEPATIATPAILAEPDPPQGETETGGTLPLGLIYYGVTALRGDEQSILSTPISITVTPGEQQVRLTMPTHADAEQFQIWRMASTDIGYTRIGLTADAVSQFVDDGSVPADPCACDPDNLPPTENDGIAQYSVEVTLSAADAAYVTSGAVSSWRLYRTEDPGTYSATSLVHDTVEREDEVDLDSPLMISWVDDGDDLLDGIPPLSNQALSIQPYSISSGPDLPPVGDVPDGYPFIQVVDDVPTLYLMWNDEWVAAGGGGGGGGGVTGTTVPAPSTAPDGKRWVETVASDGSRVSVASAMPGPPGAPTVTASSSASVTWTHPVYDGGLPRTGYLLRAYDMAARTVTDVPLAADVVTYTFPAALSGYVAVMAQNAVGFGLAGEAQAGVLVPTWRSNNDGVSGTTTAQTVTPKSGVQVGDYEVLLICWNGNATAAPFEATIADFVLRHTVVHPSNTESIGIYTRTVANLNSFDVPGRAAGQWVALLRTYTKAFDITVHQNVDSATTPTFPTTKTHILYTSGIMPTGTLYDNSPSAVPIQADQGVIFGNIRINAGDELPVGGVAVAYTVTPTGSVPTALINVTLELN